MQASSPSGCACVPDCTVLHRMQQFSTISHLLSLLQSATLSVHSMPDPAYQLLYYTTVLFKVLYLKLKFKRLKMFSFLSYMYYSVKSIKSIIVQYYITDCISRVPKLTSLDLKTHSWNETHLYLGDGILSAKSQKNGTCKKLGPIQNPSQHQG